MVRNCFKTEAGFTLTEVLVTLLVLAIGVLAVSTMRIEGLRSHRTALEQTTAGALASNEIEHLLSMPFDDMTSGVRYFDPSGLPVDADSEDMKYTVGFMVDPEPGLGTTIVDITVRTQWNNPGGRTRNAILRTRRARL